MLLLLTSALGLLLLFHGNRLDLLLENPWHSSGAVAWPLRDAWWSAILLHRDLRVLLSIAIMTCIAIAWRHRQTEEGRRWQVIAAAGVLIPLVVACGKRLSPMYCPWDIAQYGGNAPYQDVLSALATHGPALGHCFPAGFVSCGSWLLAFALLRYPERPRSSLQLGLGALVFALAMGLLQQARGAHFFSHTLWTLWLSWVIVLALHALLVGRHSRPEAAAST